MLRVPGRLKVVVTGGGGTPSVSGFPMGVIRRNLYWMDATRYSNLDVLSFTDWYAKSSTGRSQTGAKQLLLRSYISLCF